MEVIKLFKGVTRYLWLIRRYPLNIVDEIIDKYSVPAEKLSKSNVVEIELTGDNEKDILSYLMTDV